jgi:anthranilate phosphoribosyltransferase
MPEYAPMQDVIQRIRSGENLDVGEMSSIVDRMMCGTVAEPEIADLLLALREKGETVQEVAGAARALRQHMTPIRTQREHLIDTCGTGGDGSGTFNISTAAALVTAAAGVAVAKHGNRSITSRSGSADVLAALGVNIEAPVPVVERCLDELGICFCFAPQLHPSMKHVAAVRRKLGVPTVFNLLGPLCNPASAPFQLLGVGRPELRSLLAEAIGMLGTGRTVVVSGEDGLDEVTLAAATNLTVVTPAGQEQRTWRPEDFGLTAAGLDALRVEGPEASAAVIRSVLAGAPGAARDIVLLNAAAALWTADGSLPLPECVGRAAEAIDDGRAARLLDELANLTTG